MGETCAKGISERKDATVWAVIGGVLLAIYLPPVLAIFVVNRWKEVSRRLRTTAIALSFLFPAGAVLYGMLEKSPWRGLAYPFIGYGPIFMHASFILAWCRHRGAKVSPVLKACFWIAFVLATLGTIVWFLVVARHLFFAPRKLG